MAAPSPNPGTTTTMVRFGLTHASHVALTIYDLFGRRVRRLADDERTAGTHAIAWDYRNGAGLRVAPGLYVVKLEAGDRVLTQRAIVER